MSSSSAAGLLGVVSSMLVLTTVSIGLRMFARFYQRMPLKADDVTAIISWISYAGASTCILLLLHDKELGYTQATRPTVKMEVASKLEISWDWTGTASLTCTKLSAIFFYRRIFCVGGRKGWFDHITLAMLVIVVCWFISFNIVSTLQCGTHFSALWDGTYNTYCTHSFPYLLGLSISDFCLDVIILLLPIPRTMQLHASLAKKLSIIGVFLLAFVGLGASIARMVTFINVLVDGPAYYVTHSPEGALTETGFTAMLEMGISLVAVNLPSLWLIITSVVPEKVTHGLRSIASLSSLSSRRSGSSSRSNRDASEKTESAKTVGSTDSRPSESSAIFNGDIEAQRAQVYSTPGSDEVPHLPERSIHVHNSVSLEHQDASRR